MLLVVYFVLFSGCGSLLSVVCCGLWLCGLCCCVLFVGVNCLSAGAVSSVFVVCCCLICVIR